jgi:F0F1-type ATP synthase membrane subunit a
MTSGSMLMWMLIAWTLALSNLTLGIDFPVLLPIVLHLQWILVAFIQALVFPLLIAIFIKVVKVH